MKVFVSYHFGEESEQLMHRIVYHLKRQPVFDVYCWAGGPWVENWQAKIGVNLAASDRLILFWGQRIGDTQRDEIKKFIEAVSDQASQEAKPVYVVLPPNVVPIDMGFSLKRVDVQGLALDQAEDYARKIAVELGLPASGWVADDGLPIGYPFDYEKDIIREFGVEGELLAPKRIQDGCPIRWPHIQLNKPGGGRVSLNPLDPDDVGDFRPVDRMIRVDPRQDSARLLALPEAGPRASLYYPRDEHTRPGGTLRVGIVVSGGIAPGINAVIHGIVQRHEQYRVREYSRWKQEEEERKKGASEIGGAFRRYGLKISLYRHGFEGLRVNRSVSQSVPQNQEGGLRGDPLGLSLDLIKQRATQGGSMIGTSRLDAMLSESAAERDEALKQILETLQAPGNEIDILYVIGGDGSMRAAHAIWTRANASGRSRRLSVVGVPKTMDNDVLWVWQSFGFLSAVEKAREAILQLHTEVASNPRLCVIQLFGSDSGFVVSHAAVASGVCDAALIPEVGFTMRGLSDHIKGRLSDRLEDGAHGIVLMAETAIPQDVEDYIDNREYPDLGLEEAEKEAMRRFVGSSLLSRADLDWDRLVGGWSDPNWDWVVRQLHAEIRAILNEGRDRLKNDPTLQGLVLRALNDLLKDGDLSAKKGFPTKSVEPARHRIAVQVRKVRERLSRERHRRGFALDEAERDGLIGALDLLPIPYDARTFLRRLYLLSIADAIKLRADAEGKIEFTDQERETLTNTLGTREMLSSAELEEYLRQHARELSLREADRLVKRLTESLNRQLIQDLLPLAAGANHFNRGERRVKGQTPDQLRTGGLKIVSRVLQQDIRKQNTGEFGQDLQSEPAQPEPWDGYRVFTNEPRHLLRAIAPSLTDVIFGHRLGTLAVDNAMAGFTDFMASQWLTEYVLVPLSLVVLGRKRVPQNGIFWKSVLAGTGQPPDM